MLTRRSAITGLALLTAAPVFGQGKKSAGGGDGSDLRGIDGTYSANGMNADGTRYEGRVDIVQQGEAVEFTWKIGDDTFRGAGQISGDVVTVDWGDAHPVAYIVMQDGELHGTWADGTALEKLTPR